MEDPSKRSEEEWHDWMREKEKYYSDYSNSIKTKLGGHATIIWLIFGIILHFYYGKSLFTLFSLGFFIIGMFLAAIVIGGINYILLRLLLHKTPIILMIIQIILPFILTWIGFKLVYN